MVAYLSKIFLDTEFLDYPESARAAQKAALPNGAWRHKLQTYHNVRFQGEIRTDSVTGLPRDEWAAIMVDDDQDHTQWQDDPDVVPVDPSMEVQFVELSDHSVPAADYSFERDEGDGG